MTTAALTPAGIPAGTDPASGTAVRRTGRARKVALLGGIAYLVTFAASIPQLALYSDIVADPAGYIGTPRDNGAVLVGSWLEVVTAAACVATAVALYPVTRRVSRSAAIGFVSTRAVEAAIILVGVMCILSVVTLQQRFGAATGAQADALGITGEALVAMRQWTFLLGPGLIAGLNGLFLATVMYRGRLVPRLIPLIGLAGAPLILMSSTVTIFGGWGQTSTAGALCAVPIALWEFSLGVWLTFKGFRPSPVIADLA
jgi:hypothetical protein